MGRIGTMVYDFMRGKYGETVLGFDFNAEKVRNHCEAGRRVVYGDPTDPDFYPRIKRQDNPARMVILAMPKHQANLTATRHLVEVGFPGQIAAIAQFDDQVEELREAGAHASFNFYSEAGLGFAEHAWEVLEGRYDPEVGS
jgi:Trk K+ transport system NAD-binding subunit